MATDEQNVSIVSADDKLEQDEFILLFTEWTESLLFAKNKDENRIFINYDNGVITLLLSYLSYSPEQPRKRKRLSEVFQDAPTVAKYKRRIVELVKAYCDPASLEEDVWMANPRFSDPATRGDIRKLVYHLTSELKRIRKAKHEKARDLLDNYLGMTLHEIIIGTKEYASRPEVAIGRRGNLGKIIQDAILDKFKIDKETFKQRHYKKKEDYSENYFIVYRTAKEGESEVSECDVARTCLNTFLGIASSDDDDEEIGA